MTLKTKLASGLGFLFAIIFALCCFCSYYVGTLGQESGRILKDNYDSLVYARNMVAGLDDMGTSIANSVFNAGRDRKMSEYYAGRFESGRKLFEANIEKEKHNITEIHEKEDVEELTQNYDSYLKLCLQLKSGSAASATYFSDFVPASQRLNQSINTIYDVNMQAVIRKSQSVQHDSARFVWAMGAIGSICLVLALAYFWYFPVYISTTLSYLSNRMRDLLKKSGISFDTKTNDEAFVMLEAIQVLETKLGVKTGDAPTAGKKTQ
ncbi:MAG TPA: hypothetical protein VMT62_08475 [Syntrophorhabdaceae bacterium]|nr:hypothetical protein [Syntrophorhabdaceae bacterium]